MQVDPTRGLIAAPFRPPLRNPDRQEFDDLRNALSTPACSNFAAAKLPHGHTAAIAMISQMRIPMAILLVVPIRTPIPAPMPERMD